MKFYDREQEMDTLHQAAAQPGAAMIILSGRRRVGKSRLVDEFLKKEAGTKIMIVPKEEKQVAADFGPVLSDAYTPAFNTVKEALEYFFLKASQRILHIDEFPNVLDVNPAIPYELQRLWDTHKDHTNKILILSGSYTRMMDQIFTRQKAPLFNRATFNIVLQPLTPSIIWEMQNEAGILGPEQQITNHCLFGGIPHYYEVIEKYGQTDHAEKLFFGVGPLREEGQNLLRQEFGAAYKKYFSILEAISAGDVSSGEIANQLGIRQTTLSKYMQTLQNDFKLIERSVPFGQNPAKSKKGTYKIRDNLLSFWFTHVYGKTQSPQPDALNAFVGKRFENLCMDVFTGWLEKKTQTVLKRGRWTGTIETGKGQFEQREIDLVIETSQATYVGECKWTDREVGEKELRHLEQSAQGLHFKKPVTWVLFTKKKTRLTEGPNLLLFDAHRLTHL